MQLINIFPLGNICGEYAQSMHMFLTHLVEKYKMYAKVAQDVSGYKILDNSVIELGNAVSIERIVKAAEKIQADEIILPDVFMNCTSTIESTKRAIDSLYELYPRKKWSFKLMAVAQGATISEWYKCYKTLLDMPEVDVIGIPKVLATMHPEGRPYFVNKYCDLNTKPHHLLGLWYSFTEFRRYNNLEKIRSCDTSLLSYLIKNNLDILDVRSDNFTIDLELDVFDFNKLQNMHFGGLL